MPKTNDSVTVSSSSLDSLPIQTITVAPPENTSPPIVIPSVFSVKEFDFQLGLSNEEKEALRDELKRFNWMSNALREKLIKRLS